MSAESKRYKAAKKALEANSKSAKRRGVKVETARYNKLNHEVNEAMKAIPWWRR